MLSCMPDAGAAGSVAGSVVRGGKSDAGAGLSTGVSDRTVISESFSVSWRRLSWGFLLSLSIIRGSLHRMSSECGTLPQGGICGNPAS
ncbi:hypothetical protein GCM10010234_50130 [Streptomyces hawaiiensis]